MCSGPWSGERYDECDGVWQLRSEVLSLLRKVLRQHFFQQRRLLIFFFLKISTGQNLLSLWNRYSHLKSKKLSFFIHNLHQTIHQNQNGENNKIFYELCEGIFYLFFLTEGLFHLKLTSWLEGNILKLLYCVLNWDFCQFSETKTVLSELSCRF